MTGNKRKTSRTLKDLLFKPGEEMNEEILIENIKYLAAKYLIERIDLSELIVNDPDSAKFNFKNCSY